MLTVDRILLTLTMTFSDTGKCGGGLVGVCSVSSVNRKKFVHVGIPVDNMGVYIALHIL